MATKSTATKSKTDKKETKKPEKQGVKPEVKITDDNSDKDLTIEEKLSVLHNLQKIVSEIDDIKTLRGDLPLEVQDLEDEIVGLNTRQTKFNQEIKEINVAMGQKRHEIEESRVKIQKYTSQQDNVRNNREFDNLSKEIEFQTLEVELSEKRIREFAVEKERLETELNATSEQLKERKGDLKSKKSELNEIVTETKQEEDVLRDAAKDLETKIEPRLLTAFKRIRKNARNGLAIVTVQRDACGGCFNKIPAQRQLDIRQRKKIIVCEYCGRILIDKELAGEE
ncbi:MAG: C4-type zinc ribbon domain-containing protein [Prevotellaceae bacterium]|jgi:predicted  nucleic acid-binding Zn-ribbon protein|nr:C4-type zinc ribbon domain-containing protein [Prevotellaceae bacterium]